MAAAEVLKIVYCGICPYSSLAMAAYAAVSVELV